MRSTMTDRTPSPGPRLPRSLTTPQPIKRRRCDEDEPLKLAIMDRDLDKVNCLLDKNPADATSFSMDCKPPMMHLVWAMDCGTSVEVVDKLLATMKGNIRKSFGVKSWKETLQEAAERLDNNGLGKNQQDLKKKLIIAGARGAAANKMARECGWQDGLREMSNAVLASPQLMIFGRIQGRSPPRDPAGCGVCNLPNEALLKVLSFLAPAKFFGTARRLSDDNLLPEFEALFRNVAVLRLTINSGLG
mmetsp:Transcript_118836/g.380712  ORF Transcript_118836/g.380712 Transcript_118836/m.380712 type:complete len:246 (-) Transcript_118836:143-880(-)